MSVRKDRVSGAKHTCGRLIEEPGGALLKLWIVKVSRRRDLFHSRSDLIGAEQWTSVYLSEAQKGKNRC
jgi:hypothetical protein